jgi:hypothetical protein
LVRKLPPLLFGFGIRPEHVQQEVQRRPRWSRVGPWIAGTLILLALAWVIRRLMRRS